MPRTAAVLLAIVGVAALGTGVRAKSTAHPTASGEAAARPGRELGAVDSNIPDGFRKGKEREIKTLTARDPHAIMQAKAFVKEQNEALQQYSSASLGLKAMLYALSEKDIVLLDEEAWTAGRRRRPWRRGARAGCVCGSAGTEWNSTKGRV